MNATDPGCREEGQPTRRVPEKATEEERQRMERTRIFMQNRYAYPPEKLFEEHAGQWIAWSADGTHVVAASSESDEAVYDLVVAAGINPAEVVFDYVPGE